MRVLIRSSSAALASASPWCVSGHARIDSSSGSIPRGGVFCVTWAALAIRERECAPLLRPAQGRLTPRGCGRSLCRMHAAPLWVLLQTPGAAPELPPAGITLPAGPAARAFKSVKPDTAPARLELKALPPWPDGAAWNDSATWLAWAEDVRAEARAERADPARRARLCVFARAQNRSDDAWDHFAALAGEPTWCAALL